MTNCTACGKQLTGGIDTFGLPNEPMCWNCYAGLNGGDGFDAVYGLGPHVHTFNPETGQMTTMFLDQSPTDEFMPDPDAPGLGVWVRRVPIGWR